MARKSYKELLKEIEEGFYKDTPEEERKAKVNPYGTQNSHQSYKALTNYLGTSTAPLKKKKKKEDKAVFGEKEPILEIPTVEEAITKFKPREQKPWYESFFDGVKGVGSSLAYGATEGIGALGTVISENVPYMLSNEIATEKDMADYEKVNNITKETRQQIIDKYLKEYGDIDQATTQIATLYNDKAEILKTGGGLAKFQNPEKYEQLEKEVAELEYVRDLLQQTRGGKPFTDDVGDAMKAGLDWIGAGQFVDEFKEELSVPFDLVRELGQDTVEETAQEFAQEHSFIGGLSQSIGALIPAMAATAVTKNTAVGTTVFTASAKGSYYEDYIERGYTNREAENASTTMAAVELGTEFLGGWVGGINVFKKGELKKLAEKSGIKTLRALKIEGLEEATAELANIGIDMNLGEDVTLAEAGERVGTAFVSGVALGAVMKGAGVAGSKAQALANKISNNEQITEDELVEALEEVAEQNNTTVEALLEQEVTEMQQTTEQETVQEDILPTQEQETAETEKNEAPQAEISDVSEQSQQVIFPEVETAENVVTEPNTAIEENIPIETAQNVSESEIIEENDTQSEDKKQIQVYNAVRLDEKNANLDAETKPHGLFLSNLYETDFNEFESPFARQYEGGERHHYKVEPKNPLVVKPLVLDNAKYKYRSGNMATMDADASLSALKELVGEQEFTKVSEMSKQELVEYLNNKYSQYDFSNYYDKAELLMAYGSVEARNQGYDAIITERSTDPDTADIDNEIVVLKNDILKTEAEQEDIAPVKETKQEEKKTKITDTTNKELSAEIASKTKNSKVRDENGNLMRMYHGSPNGTYSQLRGGTYFTPNKEYAKRYESASASSISAGKETNNPKTYEAYLNIEKPFDISDKEAKEVYINDYIKGGNAIGINPYMSDAEYDAIDSIDWTEVEDLKDFLEENGYDYDGIVADEGGDGGYGDAVTYRGKSYIPFNDDQIIQLDTTETTTEATQTEQVAEQVQEAVKPLQETVSELTEQVKKLTDQIENAALNNPTLAENVADTTLDQQVEANNEPTEMEDTTPDFDDNQKDTSTVESPFENRDIKEVGNRKVKAYMYENPEVKPYFQEAANEMLGDLKRTTKGQRIYNPELAYEQGTADQNGAFGWVGMSRQTTDDIAYLIDNFGYTYAQIEEGLNKIIEDNGLENNAVSKRIEFALNDRLMNGYVDISGIPMPPNQDYINLLDEKQISEYHSNRFADMTDEQLDEELARNTTETTPEANTDTLTEETTPDIPIAENVSETATEDAETVVNTRHEEIISSNTTETSQTQTTVEPTTKPTNTIYDNMVDDTINRAARNIATVEASGYGTNRTEKAKRTFREKVKNALNTLQDLMVNRSRAVDQYAKETGNKEIKYKNDRLNNVMAEINGEINVAQTDLYGNKIGDAMITPFLEADNAGLREDFNYYLTMLANIERSARDKGLGTIDAVTSAEIVKAYEQEHPEFIEWKNKVVTYNRNALYNDVTAGIVSKELADQLTAMYPNYMPYYFDIDNNFVLSPDEIKAGKTVKTAVGGGDITKMFTIEEAMAKQTISRKIAQIKNDLLTEIVNSKSTVTEFELGNIEASELGDTVFTDASGKKYATAYIEGKAKTVEISDDLYNAFNNDLDTKIKELEEKFELITKPLQTATTIFGKMNTTWSLTFPITNPIKDMFDAPLNSKHTARWLGNAASGRALYKISTNDTTWQQFKSLYGTDTLQQEYGGGVKTEKIGKNVKFLNKIGNFNQFVEMYPRYIEFLSSLEAGNSTTEALYNAREVTTNFGRGGTIAKAINRNGVAFYNVSIQGFDKLIRNFSGENGAMGVVKAFAKVTALGMLPAIFNHLLFGDDEEYEELSDYVKDNYYLIKVGDGTFFRIPKGRMISVFGSAARRTLELAEGEENAFDGYLTNAWTQVGFSNPITDNIFSGFIDVANNETWYGSDLIPTRLQDAAPEEQYDESTDEFSKWLGEQIGVSPIKTNYLLDQYGGSIADIVLPMITDEAKSDKEGVLGTIGSIFTNKFTSNSTFNNKYVSEFYDTKDKINKIPNSKATEEEKLQAKYLNDIGWELSDLYKKKRTIQTSLLDNAEKYKAVEKVQREIDDISKAALDQYKDVDKSDDYAVIGDKEYYKKDNTWEKVKDKDLEDVNGLGLTTKEKGIYFNTKTELGKLKTKDEKETHLYKAKLDKTIKTAIYENSVLDGFDKEDTHKAYKTAKAVGVDIDTWLDFEKQTFYANKDKNGDSISGTKKKKVISYINSLDLSVAQKAIMIKLQYPADKDYIGTRYNKQIVSYVSDLNMSYAEKVEILENIGMKVDSNGNVKW